MHHHCLLFAWNEHKQDFTSNPSKRKTQHGTSTTPSGVEMGALRGAVAHQRTQLQEAKAIIKQQRGNQELRDKETASGGVEALKAECGD
jgi:hypothetical protein